MRTGQGSAGISLFLQCNKALLASIIGHGEQKRVVYPSLSLGHIDLVAQTVELSLRSKD